MMKSNINREKCKAWTELLLAIMRMTKELNIEEKKHILNCFLVGVGLAGLRKEKESKE